MLSVLLAPTTGCLREESDHIAGDETREEEIQVSLYLQIVILLLILPVCTWVLVGSQPTVGVSRVEK